MASRHNIGGQYFFSPMEKPLEEKPEFKLFDSENNQASLQKLLFNKAETCEEKFKILDARDKLYKLMQLKNPTLKREALSATCPDMCPEKERLLREYQNRGSIFEMTNFSRNYGFNQSLAVKEYARSSADQEEPLPHELRPIRILTMTMSHLLHNVADYCELSDENLEEWYMFMWDRTRALRKELTQQGLCCLESVTIVEQCARFHIHSAERLVDQDSSIYDDKINTENLTKCLQTLKYMYKDLAKEDIKCSNEAEFVCYALLLNLNNSSVFTDLSDMSSSLMTSEAVKFALDIMTTWETKNYIRFFDLVKKTTYLNSCLLRRYFGEMRLYAIKTMIRCYCTKNYSPQIALSRFVKNLNFEGEEECLNFLSECNFSFHEVEGMTVVNFNRLHFQNPQTTLSTGRAYMYIEEKKTRPLSVVLSGGILPSKSYENHMLENSFTDSGYLKESVLAQFELTDVSMPPSTSTSGLFDAKAEIPSGTIGEMALVPSEVASNASSADISQKQKSNEFRKITGLEGPLFGTSQLFSSSDSTPFKGIFASAADKPDRKVPVLFGSGFLQAQPTPLFDSTSQIFHTESNVFGNKIESATPFQGRSMGFVEKSKPLYDLNFSKKAKGEEKDVETKPSGEFPKSFPFASFKFQPPEPALPIEEKKDGDLESEEAEREKRLREKIEEAALERKRQLEEEEEEEERKREVMERFRKLEEERRETEKREREERLRREEEARLEREEQKKKDERERLEKIREAEVGLKKLEESKRKIELEYRLKVDRKMAELKTRWQEWKTKLIFDKWRTKTWTRIEGRKMTEYLRGVRKRYPPVCTEELLNYNPYGLVIPNMLVFEKFQDWRRELERGIFRKRERKMVIVSNELPLLKINSLLGKSIEAHAKRLKYKINPFPWKLVISVPDELESPEFARSLETFIEMHFVDDLQWEFGAQKGPLYCQKGAYKSFQFVISVRRARGSSLHEGCQSNPSVVEGSDVIIFLVNGTGNEKSRSRLKTVVTSRRPEPKVPVILFGLADDAEDLNGLKKILNMSSLEKSRVSECHVVPVMNRKHDVVARLIDCLHLAVSVSSPPSSLRVAHLSEFFTEMRLDSLWRRIAISLSNFKIVLDEPKVLIEFYNFCIDYLSDVFLDESTEKRTALAEEFSESSAVRPNRSFSYRSKLKSALEEMKFPGWPAETPKSCHQLNYRIHQYCKKLTGGEKLKMKNLKWRLYRIIRRSLLWKGLDIYCDEDIRQILAHFPWIQVFQEISRVLSHRLKETTENDKSLSIIYDEEILDGFNFETSVVGKLLKKSRRKTSGFRGEEETSEEFSPRLENDSVVYAYTAALERERVKRKREEEDEYWGARLHALFSSQSKKGRIGEETGEVDAASENLEDLQCIGMMEDQEKDEEDGKESKVDLAEIECNLQSLDDRLEQLKKRLSQNEATLLNIQCQLK